MTDLYCFIDDYLKAHPQRAGWRSSPNCRPAFTDAEVLTIALMQSPLRVASLKQTYRLIVTNFASAFPKLCSYKQWIARLHRLGDLVGQMIEAARRADGFSFSLYVIDSKPIPVCKPIRHRVVRLLRDAGAYFSKSSVGWFFGFKLHVLLNIEGRVVSAALTAANTADREAAVWLAAACDGGIVGADQAYGGEETCEALARQAEMLVLTSRLVRPKKGLMSRVRQPIETFFARLCHQFIDKVYSRSFEGLWNTIKLKLLAYNLSHAGLLSC
jgi:transposase